MQVRTFKTYIMYKYLFGPVPSRRLGVSLGIDLVPRKVCSLDCVYCEVGQTTKKTLDRDEYILYEKVITELMHYFINRPDPEYITFSGYGEPTLNSRIGDIIQFVRKQKPGIPVAVLTNGTLFYDEDVRKSIQQANLVIPSLDAASEAVFQKINRPHKSLTIHKFVDGLIRFRQEFTGKIWLEVFILPGYNDSEEELTNIRDVILKSSPDMVQLNTLDRPGTVSDLRSATRSELQRVIDFWGLDHVEIIAARIDRKSIQSYRDDHESAILETIARRPCTVDDLASVLGCHVFEVSKYLDVLEEEKKIEGVRKERGVFYRILG
jgi:wyosine [tRNA(Phe)-imidazoG37] synthetase (radical SAM superfamily)